MPRGRKKGDGYLDPLRSLLIARLLLEGVSQRETAARAHTNREAVKRIQLQLAAGKGSIFGALARQSRDIGTADLSSAPAPLVGVVRHSGVAAEPFEATMAPGRRVLATGRQIRHEEVLMCLVRKTAIAVAAHNAKEPRARHRPELVTAAEIAAVLPGSEDARGQERGDQGAAVRRQ